jgi:type III secretory pathway component EscV
MTERRETILVAVAVVAAIVCFVIPMPWAAIPAAIALLLGVGGLVVSKRR